MYYSLEEAIARPPPAIGEKPEKRAPRSGDQVVPRNQNVLSGWCERPSLQSFMNYVCRVGEESRIKAEQQMKLHEQIRERAQQQLVEGQRQERLKAISQKQGTTLGTATSSAQQNLKESSVKDEGHQSTGVNPHKKPSVKKVMRNGVLVSIPIRQAKQQNTQQSTSNVSSITSVPFTSNKQNVGAGNILDDILARAKANENSENSHDKTKKIKQPEQLLSEEPKLKTTSPIECLSEGSEINKSGEVKSSDSNKPAVLNEKTNNYSKIQQSLSINQKQLDVKNRQQNLDTVSQSLSETTGPQTLSENKTRSPVSKSNISQYLAKKQPGETRSAQKTKVKSNVGKIRVSPWIAKNASLSNVDKEECNLLVNLAKLEKDVDSDCSGNLVIDCSSMKDEMETERDEINSTCSSGSDDETPRLSAFERIRRMNNHDNSVLKPKDLEDKQTTSKTSNLDSTARENSESVVKNDTEKDLSYTDNTPLDQKHVENMEILPKEQQVFNKIQLEVSHNKLNEDNSDNESMGSVGDLVIALDQDDEEGNAHKNTKIRKTSTHNSFNCNKTLSKDIRKHLSCASEEEDIVQSSDMSDKLKKRTANTNKIMFSSVENKTTSVIPMVSMSNSTGVSKGTIINSPDSENVNLNENKQKKEVVTDDKAKTSSSNKKTRPNSSSGSKNREGNESNYRELNEENRKSPRNERSRSKSPKRHDNERRKDKTSNKEDNDSSNPKRPSQTTPSDDNSRSTKSRHRSRSKEKNKSKSAERNAIRGKSAENKRDRSRHSRSKSPKNGREGRNNSRNRSPRSKSPRNESKRNKSSRSDSPRSDRSKSPRNETGRSAQRKRKREAKDSYKDKSKHEIKVKEECERRSSVEPKRSRTSSTSSQENHKGRVTRSMIHTNETPPKPHNISSEIQCNIQNEAISDDDIPLCEISKKSKINVGNNIKDQAQKGIDEERSLLSLVQDVAVDITVQEPKKKKTSGGKKKKKKKKLTPWFLRQLEIKRQILAGTYVAPAPKRKRVCQYYQQAKCTNGTSCTFAHEKMKEVCSYYLARGNCDKLIMGMCPKMHGEFPCMYFHKRNFCKNRNDCKFSHEVLTEDMKTVLDNYHEAYYKKREELYSNLATPDQNTTTQPNFTNPSGLPEATCTSQPTFQSPNSITRSTTIVSPIPTVTDLNPVVPASGSLTDSPKVRRLCSLSSYKPQILPKFTTFTKTQETNQNSQMAETSSPKKSDFTFKKYLPGMFTEK